MKTYTHSPVLAMARETCSIYHSPVGELYVVTRGDVLTTISFTKPMVDIGRQVAAIHVQLDEYFLGKRKLFDLNTLFIHATAFEKKVYDCLLLVPYGQTRTYSWIAKMAGSPRGARAAGQALRKNPIPIVYPCHRIIAVDGSLGGYSPDVAIKIKLLEREGISL